MEILTSLRKNWQDVGLTINSVRKLSLEVSMRGLLLLFMIIFN